MTDPRAKAWQFIEELVKEHPEHAEALEGHKEKLKAWGEQQVQKATDAIAERGQAQEQFEALVKEKDELTQKIEGLSVENNEPSAELVETRKQLEELQKQFADAQQIAKDKDDQLFFSGVKGEFMKGANLKDDFAESKIDLLIATKAINRAEDGTTEINYNGNKFTVDTFAEHLRENHPTQVKVVEGGKKGGFSNDPAQAPDKQQALAARVSAGTGGKVVFKGV